VPAALHAQALMFGAVVARLSSEHNKGHAGPDRSIALWRNLDDRVGLALA